MKTYLATLLLALASAATLANDLTEIQALDAQIAILKAQRAATVKTLDPVSKAELRVLQAHEGLRKAQERAGKAPKAPRAGKTGEVLL
jgi:hypothetical protein